MEVLGERTFVFANAFTLSMLFMRHPFAEENILIRRERSFLLSLPIAFILLNEKGEKGPGADLCTLEKIPAQMLVKIPLANVTLPIPM